MAKRLPPSLRDFKPTPRPPPVDTFGLINMHSGGRQPPPPGGGSGSPITPALTSPSANATGATTASLSVSSNVGGTLFWIVTVNATVPTAAQVKAGNDGTGAPAAASGSQAMASGTNNSTATGLTSNTAYNAFWTTDKNLAPPTTTFTTQFDPAVVSWAAQVVTNGGTVSTARKGVVNTLVGSLKTNNIWTKLDRLWLTAAENTQSALTDLSALTLATVTGAPTFTANRGYTGSDLAVATNYINSGFTPSSSGVNYTQNSAHMSAWNVTNNAASNGGALFGSTDGVTSVASDIYDTFTDGNVYGRINDATASGSQGAPGTRIGWWLVNRSDSTHSQLYQNGSLFSSPNAASGALSTTQLDILADRGGSGPQNGTPNQVACVSVGASLSATDASNFYTALRAYMTAIGVP